MEDVKGFCCLGETLVGSVGTGMLEGRVVGEGQFAVAVWEKAYLAQICWMVALWGTPRIL